MNPRNDIQAELTELGSGLSAPSSLPYAVPEGYFATFPERMLLLARMEGLADDPKAELEALSPLLSGLDRRAPFSVPEGYFSAPVSIPAGAAQPAKVVTMRHRFMRLAAAATIAGVTALGGYLYLSARPSEPGVNNPEWVARQLKGVSDETLEQFIRQSEGRNAGGLSQTKDPEVAQLLGDVSSGELNAFLDGLPTDEHPEETLN